MANDTPLAVLKSLLMIVFTAIPDPDEIAGHVDSGEIASIDFMIKILANIEECVEMISLRLATDSIDGNCLHNSLALFDCWIADSCVVHCLRLRDIGRQAHWRLRRFIRY